ncbi:hypothetical protein EBU91_01375, partial [bacterium]|nr:hypothetical protein [bacterium]
APDGPYQRTLRPRGRPYGRRGKMSIPSLHLTGDAGRLAAAVRSTASRSAVGETNTAPRVPARGVASFLGSAAPSVTRSS